MKQFIYFLLITLSLIGFGCARKTAPIVGVEESQTGQVEINIEQILYEAKRDGLIMNDAEILAMASANVLQESIGKNVAAVNQYLKNDFKGWNSAALADVTAGGSFGLAFSKFEKGSFTFVAQIGNLPELAEGSRYEGWIVERGDSMKVMSVGEAKKNEDEFIIVYRAPKDLTVYNFFVLTLESDENPLPDKHILEGMIK
ncbi:hypothetical protein HY771_03000 [Candidatus Uhrbacteria bacterium]|nr:hypothetical protein [Candidatus Uhrbacteria bacterium]